MIFHTPRIIDSSLSHAISVGCDCVMLKHDGFPVTINCAAQQCNIIAEWPGAKRESIENIQLHEPLDALLVGARSRFTPVVHLYDCWWLNGQDVQMLTYRERYVLTRMSAKKLDERFVMVPALPIQAAHELWKDVVADPDSLKGLVFRRSKDTSVGDVYVKRYYKEMPEELT